MDEPCCTCATLFSTFLPSYDEKSEKPLPLHRRLECCGRLICGKCLAVGSSQLFRQDILNSLAEKLPIRILLFVSQTSSINPGLILEKAPFARYRPAPIHFLKAYAILLPILSQKMYRWLLRSAMCCLHTQSTIIRKKLPRRLRLTQQAIQAMCSILLIHLMTRFCHFHSGMVYRRKHSVV